MAKDFDIAREIIASLETLQADGPFLRSPCLVSLNHDDHIESEQIKDTEIRVSPEQFDHTRIARAAWQINAGIRVKLVSKAKDYLDVSLLEDWCDFVDQITGHLKTIKVAGNRSSTITLRNNDRYDQRVLKESSAYSTTLLVGYLLI